MVDVGPDGLITRRRLSRTELATIEAVPAVVEAFAAARLVSTDRDTVEIAHEALIRAWPRLRDWVEESRAGLRLHRQLTEAAAAWEAFGAAAVPSPSVPRPGLGRRIHGSLLGEVS